MDDFFNNNLQEQLNNLSSFSQDASSDNLKFFKPKTLFERSEDPNELYTGTFTMRPLERGYGVTIGNALRRVLLSSLSGAAIVSIRVEGGVDGELNPVMHEFSSVPGVVEDVTSIVLNLKGVVLKFLVDGLNESKLEIDEEVTDKPLTITAENIRHDERVEIINPNQYICRLNAGHIRIQITARRGRGYVSADENRELLSKSLYNEAEQGLIAIDSLYTPVTKVAYHVNKFRVEDNPNYEELVMEVTTNGGVNPDDAIATAAKILTDQLSVVVTLSETAGEKDHLIDKQIETVVTPADRPIEELDLNTRPFNCLKRAGIKTLRELTQMSEDDMIRIRNLGSKSIQEIKVKLNELGLSFAKR
jgi:DNA-directed RNA polymerase subunit alpha